MATGRQWTDIEILAVEAGGSIAELGLISNGQGSRMWATVDDIGHFARKLLSTGLQLESAGASLPDATLARHAPMPVQCTEVLVGTLDQKADEALLTLRFGAIELPVLLNSSDIRQALALLDTAMQGGVLKGTDSRQ